MKTLILTCFLLGGAVASSHGRNLRRAVITDPTALATQEFDYVVVGGGNTGLAIARRLSDNSDLKVAVIEAGSFGDDVPNNAILVPSMAYMNGVANINSPYDWHFSTVAQSGLNGRSIYWPRGKVLGGSAAVNGLYMVRHSKIEQDSWAGLLSDKDADKLWGWDPVFEGLKKSESYTPPLHQNLESAGVVVDQSAHGTDGPIHYSYPGFFYPQTSSWIPTWKELGVATRDPAGGETWGAYVATSCINPSNWTRSYAKTGYLDPVIERSNLVIVTGFTTTKILFNGTTATGVEFSESAAGPTYSINAKREVILSGGVIGSPQLLLVSGVGPKDELEALHIPIVAELPGVGMHLADHVSGAIVVQGNEKVTVTGDLVRSNENFAAEQLEMWNQHNSQSIYNSPNHAIAYIDLPTLLGGASAAQDFIKRALDNKTAAIEAYSKYHSSDPTVLRGFEKTYTSELVDVYDSLVGQAEILLSNTGTYGSYPDALTMSVQAALQHPLAKGSLKINSTSIFDPPIIDPGYLSNDADLEITRAAFRLARKFSQTAPFSELVDKELSPGDRVADDDDEWNTFIRSRVGTEFHPQGTCSMLPLEDGGVVDSHLRVYGTKNLRVVDGSIVPVGMSAHLMAPLYGIAERATELILSSDASETGPDATKTGFAPGASNTGGASNLTIGFGFVVVAIVAVLW